MTQSADRRASRLLMPVKNRQPRRHLLGLPGIAGPPTLRWKLLNLGRMSAKRHPAAADSVRRGPESDRSSRAARPGRLPAPAYLAPTAGTVREMEATGARPSSKQGVAAAGTADLWAAASVLVSHGLNARRTRPLWWASPLAAHPKSAGGPDTKGLAAGDGTSSSARFGTIRDREPYPDAQRQERKTPSNGTRPHAIICAP